MPVSAKQQIQELPLDIAAGNTFGRYGKISQAQTWNMIVSDEWLVPYAGYKALIEANPTEPGRGLYASKTGNIMVAVIGRIVYRIDHNLTITAVVNGILDTSEGDVWMAENNNHEIAITDGMRVYIYKFDTGVFYSSNPTAPNTFTPPFPVTFTTPGYISFHNSRFIIALQ